MPQVHICALCGSLVEPTTDYVLRTRDPQGVETWVHSECEMKRIKDHLQAAAARSH